jgi:aconitate hydratase
MVDRQMKNSFGACIELTAAAGTLAIFSLPKFARENNVNISRMPYSIRVLLESLLRCENGHDVTKNDILNLAAYDPRAPQQKEIPFKPARVLLQDFTGVPCVVDLAAMRSAMAKLGGDPQQINPRIPVDLVIDHSVQVDSYNSPNSLLYNADKEFERNRERYEFLRWGQKAFANFRVVPPASGICHQVNLEYLANVVQVRTIDGKQVAFPDSLVGTDSHTTMINGLGVVGWGVGGIEAEAVMLDQPLYLLMPEVIGVKLHGQLSDGVTATDLVLAVTQILRKKGVVNKFVEFFGPGLSTMSVPDRATISNMAPEYGATIGFFPVDDQTLNYLRITGRPTELVDLVERYYKEQGLYRTDNTPDPMFKEQLDLDLSTIVPSLAGPKRPQDRIELKEMKSKWRLSLSAPIDKQGFNLSDSELEKRAAVKSDASAVTELKHGDIVIAAITSCTNTSNPSVMIAAGLLAKKAVEAGLSTNPNVKTSLAPGSKAVTDYLRNAGLDKYLDKLGFYLVGYGCTTCIGNSGPLDENISSAINDNKLIVASVLSGNRNFEGRVHQDTRANFLASPPLVVAYALAGTVDIDLLNEPIGKNNTGQPIFLKDIWPTQKEITEALNKAINADIFKGAYKNIESSNDTWNKIPVKGGQLYEWNDNSTYIQQPPFFIEMTGKADSIKPIKNARVLVKVGSSVTTDHISPAGTIAVNSPAGQYLTNLGVRTADFNSYGSRRGNDRVMTRGTFANIRLKNQLAPGTEGNWTTYFPTDDVVSIYDASLRYKEAGIPTIVLAGADYGMGSSRDWAAKGTYLLGVRAVIAESFERIHRSNLVGMGVLPLQFKPNQEAHTLGLTGREIYTIDLDDNLGPLSDMKVDYAREDGSTGSFITTCRIDMPVEIDYYRHGGIMQAVLRNILTSNKSS